MISFIISMLLLASQVEPSYTLTVNVTGLESNTGNVYIGLYDGPELWLEDAPFGDKTKVLSDRSATLTIDNLEPGDYAISFYHDANGNGEMDYNLVGYPKEDFGFSAGARAVFKAPEFEEAIFQLSESIELTIQPQ